MRRPLLNHTEPGDTVYDPFLGSGTTLAAAEMTSRCCLGIDIDARYVDVVVLRWQALTGRQAVLDGESKTFEEVKRLRSTANQGAA
jgi:DNA modification methylase